jgi:hypothetical protein
MGELVKFYRGKEYINPENPHSGEIIMLNDAMGE